MVAKSWYYQKDGQRKGPVDSTTLKRLAAEGIIQPATMIQLKGTTKAGRAGGVKGLFETAGRKPDSPPESDLPKSSHVELTETSRSSDGCDQSAESSDVNSPPLSLKEKLGAASKATAGRASKQLELTKLSKVALPSAYTAIGRAVLTDGHMREQLKSDFEQADSINTSIAMLEERVSNRSEGETLADKAKLVAATTKDKAGIQVCRRQFSRLAADVGRKVYERYRANGPSKLISDLEKQLNRQRLLKEEIAAPSDAATFASIASDLMPRIFFIALSIATSGLYYIWRRQGWSKRRKTAWTVGVVAVWGFVFAVNDVDQPPTRTAQDESGSSQSNSRSPTSKVHPRDTSDSEPTYVRVIEKTPIAFQTKSEVGRLAFSHNGQFLLVRDDALWSADGQQLDIGLPTHNGTTAILSQTGSELYSAITSGSMTRITMWDLSADIHTKESSVVIDDFFGSVGSGMWMTAASHGKEIFIAAGAEARVINFGNDPVSVEKIIYPLFSDDYGPPAIVAENAMFAGNGDIVVAYDSAPPSVHVFNASTGDHSLELKVDDGNRFAQFPLCDVTPNGDKIATTQLDSRSHSFNRIWTTLDWAIQADLKPVELIAFTHMDEMYFGKHNGLSVWSSTDTRKLRDFSSPLMTRGEVIQSTGSTRFVVRRTDKPLQVWDRASGELIMSIGRLEGISSYSAAISPDGTLVATGHPDGLVAIWNTSEGTLMPTEEYASRIDVLDAYEQRLERPAPPVPTQVFEQIKKGMTPQQVHRLVGGQPLDDSSASEWRDIYTEQGGLAGTKNDWVLNEFYMLDGDDDARIFLTYKGNSTTPPLIEKRIVRR